MKLTNKEKERILVLHYSTPMNPYLFEQEEAKFDRLGIALTSKSDEEYVKNILDYERFKREGIYQIKDMHEFLENVSFYTGWIPIPVFQYISIGADLINAGMYLSEGDYWSAGLYLACAGASFATDQVLKNFKYGYPMVDRLWMSSVTKQIVHKLKNKIKLNPTEVELLETLYNNKDKIFETWDNYAKEQAQRYLKNPTQYKEAYNFIYRKNLTKFKWGSPEAIRFYKEMSVKGLKFSSYVAIEGLTDILVVDLMTLPLYKYVFGTPLKQQMSAEAFNELLVIFGGDINNWEDQQKLEKAFVDKRIYHIISNSAGEETKSIGWRPNSNDFRGFNKEGEDIYSTLEYDENGENYLPCDLIPSQLTLPDNHPCIKNKFYQEITKKQLESKKLNLPYVYKKLGNDYYYADPNKNKNTDLGRLQWYKVTDATNKTYLEKQIFPQFN